MCEKMVKVDSSLLWNRHLFIRERSGLKTLIETKQVINGGLAERQVCFLSCDKKSKDDISGLVGQLPYQGPELIFRPSSTSFSVWLSSPAHKMAAGTPATPMTVQIKHGGTVRANVACQMRQPPLKRFPRSPTQWLRHTSHWTHICPMITSTCKEDWKIELLKWDHSKIKSEFMSK